MSERDVRQNALRLGRRARIAGAAKSENPMRAAGSRRAWEDGWLKEDQLIALDEKVRTAPWNTAARQTQGDDHA